MKIYHLSHTDLDGYACQFIVNFYFKSVKFYNSNYGKEINENFNSIIGDIEKDEKFRKSYYSNNRFKFKFKSMRRI